MNARNIKKILKVFLTHIKFRVELQVLLALAEVNHLPHPPSNSRIPLVEVVEVVAALSSMEEITQSTLLIRIADSLPSSMTDKR